MENIIDQDVKLVKKATKINATLDFLDQIIFGSIFFYLIMEGVHHSILIGDVITYTKCISTVKSNMETIFSLFIRLFFQFLDIKTSSEDENKKIEFKDVCFKYKSNDNYVLENINFKIDNNHIIGIVGRNGSGKSTLSKLILGFYDDYEGEILVNGVDLKNLNKISYCKQIGCVFQDYVKYETSLRENIAFGNLRILNNDNIINNALNFVQLKANIYSKEGLDVCLGNWFGGKQVSIGEWQKISIARTLVKDADLYVMDEPDSSLDAESELEMLQSYSKVFQNKLGIFILIRLAS